MAGPYTSIVTVTTQSGNADSGFVAEAGLPQFTDEMTDEERIAALNEQAQEIQDMFDANVLNITPCTPCGVNGAIVIDCGKCINVEIDQQADINSISFINCPPGKEACLTFKCNKGGADCEVYGWPLCQTCVSNGVAETPTVVTDGDYYRVCVRTDDSGCTFNTEDDCSDTAAVTAGTPDPDDVEVSCDVTETDSFTRANNNSTTNFTEKEEEVTTFRIITNALGIASQYDTVMNTYQWGYAYWHRFPNWSTDQSSEAKLIDIAYVVGTYPGYFGICIRMAGDQDNCSGFFLGLRRTAEEDGPWDTILARYDSADLGVAGSGLTVLATFAALVEGDTIRLIGVGTTIQARKNDVVISEVTDSNYTDQNRMGFLTAIGNNFYCYPDCGFITRWDDWVGCNVTEI